MWKIFVTGTWQVRICKLCRIIEYSFQTATVNRQESYIAIFGKYIIMIIKQCLLSPALVHGCWYSLYYFRKNQNSNCLH